MIASPGNSEVFYFLGNDKISFYTKNCGKTFESFKHESNTVDIKPSATKGE